MIFFDILYDEIIKDNNFVQEMSTNYNNILSKKLKNNDELSCPKRDICNINTKTLVSKNKVIQG